MRNCLIIAAKEFKAYFRTPIAYVFMTVFLIVMGWFFFWVGNPPFFKRDHVDMSGFFFYIPYVFLFFVPAISMRMWSEEKKLGTIEILLTMPIREGEVVVGKFLAGFGLLFVSLVATLPIAAILSYVGEPDYGPIWGGYISCLFLGGAYLAIGLFASGLNDNQIVAFILGLVMCFVLFLIGILPYQGILPGLVSILEYLSLSYHFESIKRGLLDSRDVVYYLSIIVFFLYLNTRTVTRRK